MDAIQQGIGVPNGHLNRAVIPFKLTTIYLPNCLIDHQWGIGYKMYDKLSTNYVHRSGSAIQLRSISCFLYILNSHNFTAVTTELN